MIRHPFEPARLLLGLLLLAAGLAYVLDAAGALELPRALLLSLVPAAFVLGAVTGLATYLLRRVLARRNENTERPAAGQGGPPLADLPFDELRRGYERSGRPAPSGGRPEDARPDARRRDGAP